jgi:hypothetical protein
VVRCRVEEEGALQLGEEGNVIEFVAALVHRREGKEWRKGGPQLCSGLRRRGGDRQAPRGHRGAQRRGQRGEATAAARGRATRGERAAGVERRRGRAGCRVLSGCPPRGIPKVVGFGLGCAEIRNSKVQTTQDLDRFRPQYA